MQIRLPQADGTLKTTTLKARPIRPPDKPAAFNRTVYAAAHVVVDPIATVDPWDASPAIDWDSTLRFREHLWSLGFKVAEAMDTAQRGMGLNWALTQELIRRSVAEARALGGRIACGAGTDQLTPHAAASLAEIEAAYEQHAAALARSRRWSEVSEALARRVAGPPEVRKLSPTARSLVPGPTTSGVAGNASGSSTRTAWNRRAAGSIRSRSGGTRRSTA